MPRKLQLTQSGAQKNSPESKDVSLERAAPAEPTNEWATSGSVSGSFDALDGYHVVGWARDESAGDSPVQIDVLADNRLVASGVADLFRGDLLEAAVGKGMHGFRIALPLDICDGQSREISVRAGPTGTALAPGTRSFQQSHSLIGGVDGLQGAFVVGWVRGLVEPNPPLTVELHVDDQPVCRTEAREPSDRGLRFALRLPGESMDGRAHVISVHVTEPFHLLGELVEVLPASLTPTEALRTYTAQISRAALLDGAAARYEALRRQVIALAQSDATPHEQMTHLRAIAAAHEQLVRGFDKLHRKSSIAPLEFPEISQPMVSIVIPVHNNVRVTRNCLCSLLLAPNRASFEVIVVDDGSTDETEELPELIKGVRFLRHKESRGFVHSCNDGGRLARGSYVLFLNNDTEVSSGWIDELLYAFDHFAGVGMAGAKLVYPNGKLQEAGGIVWNNGDPWNYGRNGNASDPRFNYTRQVDYISGACIMLPKSLWDDLGGFDERFAPAYFEDADLAFRVRDRGFKTVYTPFSQVVHFEGLSSGKTIASGGMKRFQEVNRPKFKARWSRAFRNNGTVGREADIIKDRNTRFRALVIDYTTPQPDRDAGSYAAVQEMRLLQSLGFKVTFVPDNMAFLGDATEFLQRAGVECQHAPFVLSVHELLQARGSEFDLVYVTRYATAQRHIDAIRKFAPQAKVIFNNADLHFLRELRAAINMRNQEHIANALRTRDEELGLMRKVDLVLSYSEAEQAVILSHNLDSTRIARCPWVVRLPEKIAAFEGRQGIAFLGNFSHSPNVEAVEYFVRDVMPLLRHRVPGVSLSIFGSEVPDRIERLIAPDVTVEGWVPHVSEVYEKCRVFIAPLRSGAGLKGKVISALAFGVPCVLSPIAAEGIGIRDGQEALIASMPSEWAEQVGRLYDDPELWMRLSTHARQYAASEHSFAKGQKLMQTALEAVDIFATSDESSLAFQEHDS
jgi:GT2 family glycosyltransferase/glycosyltransferase involved in cell wall biosynthesis